jgi:hypothetical protein
MPSSQRVGDIFRAVNSRLFPTVTVWNRLEGRPRTPSFDRALKAEVRDALWMVTKQWQMGELTGSDCGSPVFAKLAMETTRLTTYRPADGDTTLLAYDVPFEETVERRPVPLTIGGHVVALDLRLVMGRQWLALVAGLGTFAHAFTDAYPVDVPDPTVDAQICAHPDVWQMFSAVAGRAMDGGKLYDYLVADPGHHAYDGVVGIPAGVHHDIDVRADRFLAWFRRLITQSGEGGDAWVPPNLEYQFAVSAPTADGGEKVYTAEEYSGARLDWYSMDRDLSGDVLTPVPGSDVTGLPPDEPRTMIPIPVSFSGMPNTRWWSLEDAKTNYGDISAATTDLAKLMFLEFALVYANDWFVIPYTLPAGAISTIRGFVVTNVFGERLWVEAAGSGLDVTWQRWSMFTVTVTGAGHEAAADLSLVLLPTVAKVQDGRPVEDVALVRDEAANMVWGVETTVAMASGESRRGLEAAVETRAFYEAQLAGAPPPPPAAAPVRYRVMSSVPEHWIPFIPAHVEGSNRETQLQRAALPRVLDGDPNPPVKVRPQSTLLRQGLDVVPAWPYFVHEEEVPRAGTRLMLQFQRTRWTDGRVHIWLSVQRQTGRGEGSSGLRFDEIVDSPPPS